MSQHLPCCARAHLLQSSSDRLTLLSSASSSHSLRTGDLTACIKGHMHHVGYSEDSHLGMHHNTLARCTSLQHSCGYNVQLQFLTKLTSRIPMQCISLSVIPCLLTSCTASVHPPLTCCTGAHSAAPPQALVHSLSEHVAQQLLLWPALLLLVLPRA